MKSFKQIVCFGVLLFITMLFALQAAAELPRTREIRDKFMWGDPDDLVGCRKSGLRSEEMNGRPAAECLTAPIPRVRAAELAARSGVTLIWFPHVIFEQENRDPGTSATQVLERRVRR
jgi:hypothetical protein